eukprot:gene17452-24139_t
MLPVVILLALQIIGSQAVYYNTTPTASPSVSCDTFLITSYYNSSCGASGIWFASSGKVYVADVGDYAVREISSGSIIFAGQAKIVSTTSTLANGDGSTATAATFALPWFVITDTSNNVYVADDNNNKIRKIDTSGIITTFAGTGIFGYSGDGGPATAANIAAPKD